MNVTTFCRRLLSVSLLVASWTLSVPGAPASGAVLIDDFDDNAINLSLWKPFQQGSGPTAAETNQRLEITLPANSVDGPTAIFDAGYESVCRLRGEFDIQVDYTLLTWPPRNGVRIGVLGHVIGGVERSSGGVGDSFGEVYITDFAQGCCGFVGTGDLAGKLRMVRTVTPTGVRVEGFFFRSSDNTWVSIGSSAATAEDTGFMLLAWSHDFTFRDQEVRVAFDNFVINKGQLTCLANAGPDQTVEEEATVVLDGSNSAGTDATFLWEQLAGPAVTLSDPASATPTFTAPLLPGGFGSQVLTFRLTVSSGGQSSSDTADVMVNNVNHAPEAHAGPPQTVKEFSPVNLDGTSSFDPDGDQITFAWAQVDGIPVTLEGADTARPTFAAPEILGGVSGPHVLTFQLTVSDGGLSSSGTVTVTVEQINHAPTADAGANQTTNEGDVVTLDATASSDPDGDPVVHYTWRQESGPPVGLSNTSSPTPSFTAPLTEPGGVTLVFSLVVSDGQLNSDPAHVTVTVLNVNDPPRCDLATASPRELWPPDHKLVRVDIAGVTDPDTRGAVAITVTGVRQDEPVNGLGDGDTSPDAVLQGDHVLLRAERASTEDGRVYHVHFVATGQGAAGGRCTGTITVEVPHTKKALTVDGGELYDSTAP